jgi:hypothetical protein
MELCIVKQQLKVEIIRAPVSDPEPVVLRLHTSTSISIAATIH